MSQSTTVRLLTEANAGIGYTPRLTRVSTKTAAYSANPGEFVPVDISGGSVPVTLPSAQNVKWTVVVKVVNTPVATVPPIPGLTACTVTAQGTDSINVSGTTSVPQRYADQSKTYTSDGNGMIWITAGDNSTATLGQLYAPRYNTPGQFDVRDYGAKLDTILLANPTTAATDNTVTVSTANFTNADIGKTGWVISFGSTTNGVPGTITAVNSPTQVVMSVSPNLVVVSTGFFVYGHDDTTAIQAALTAAGAAASYSIDSANYPSSGGLPKVVIPVNTAAQGYFLQTQQITSPAGVALDAQSFGYSSLPGSSPYTHAWIFGNGTYVQNLRMHFNGGAGLQFGTGYGWNHTRIDSIETWGVGSQTSGSSYQDNILLMGTDWRVGKLYMKGGAIGLNTAAGSDSTFDEVFCIGQSSYQMKINNGSQMTFKDVKLDSGTAYGVYLDQGASHIKMTIQAFIITGKTGNTSGIFNLGQAGSTDNHRNIQVDINAVDVGGPVLVANRVQGLQARLNVSTAATQTRNTMTAVVYGAAGVDTGINPSISIDANIDPLVVPYSGTPVGIFEYTQNNARVRVGQITGENGNKTLCSTLPRSATASSVTPTTGQVSFTYFTPDQAPLVSSFNSYVRSPAQAGATLAQFGLYTVDGSGNLTLVAQSASNTSQWNSAYTTSGAAIAYDGSGNALTSYQIIAGQRYAVAVLTVGATTAPALGGQSIGSNVAGLSPLLASVSATGQTGLAASYSSTAVSASGNSVWVDLR